MAAVFSYYVHLLSKSDPNKEIYETVKFPVGGITV